MSAQSASASQAVGEALECGVETRALFEADECLVVGRLDGTVEHERPHTIGEQLGVGRAEPGAVGEADIAELIVAERRTQGIEVACRVVGADVRFERQRVGCARVGPALRFGDQRLPTGVVAREPAT